MAFRDILMYVTRIFQPRGRMFKMPYGGQLEKLYQAINSDNIGGVGRAYSDMKQIMSDILPDNPDFTMDDAIAWYRRLGLYYNPGATLDELKAGIRQKMSWTVTPLRRQNYLYIQEQLQAAGFDVYVYPNRFPDGLGGYETKTPAAVLGAPVMGSYLGSFYLGEAYLAEKLSTSGISLIVNYLEEEKDALFDITAEGYKSTFYIAGAVITDFADVPAARKIEFRQLILKLKAAQMCGILFTNYI